MKINIGALLVLAIVAVPVHGHGGGLDKNGCHTNSKTGDYHCHGSAPASSTSSPSPTSGQSFVASPSGSGSVQIAWSAKVLASDEELVKTAQHLLRRVRV